MCVALLERGWYFLCGNTITPLMKSGQLSFAERKPKDAWSSPFQDSRPNLPSGPYHMQHALSYATPNIILVGLGIMHFHVGATPLVRFCGSVRVHSPELRNFRFGGGQAIESNRLGPVTLQ
jgi:hypothetical protein